jgi:hypothetical protein
MLAEDRNRRECSSAGRDILFAELTFRLKQIWNPEHSDTKPWKSFGVQINVAKKTLQNANNDLTLRERDDAIDSFRFRVANIELAKVKRRNEGFCHIDR